MAEEIEKSMPAEQSLMDKISEKIHHHDSSSDSEYEKPDSPSAVKAKIYRLFGREKPVHKVLGGGKRMSPYLSIDRFGFLCIDLQYQNLFTRFPDPIGESRFQNRIAFGYWAVNRFNFLRSVIRIRSRFN